MKEIAGRAGIRGRFETSERIMRDWPTWAPIVWACIVCGFTAATLVSDWRWRRIPNGLTVPALILALVFHTIVAGTIGIKSAGLGFVVGFGVMFLLWLIGGGGGGDVKLLAALGAWLGPGLTMILYLASVSLAALIAVGVMFWRWLHPAAQTAAANAGAIQLGRNRTKILIPFAVPVCIATWALVAVKMAVWTH